MAQNVYEGLFLFDANKFSRDREALPKAVEEMITEGGGEVVVSRLWEERRLAYAIRGQRKGAYWLIYFRAEPEQIAGLNRKCELHGSVLRQLVLKIHPRLVEPILAHASGETVVEEEAQSTEAQPAGPQQAGSGPTGPEAAAASVTPDGAAAPAADATTSPAE